MGVAHIVKGTVNNALNKEKELYKERIEICKKCKLYLSDGILGATCNSKLYVNPKTDEVSRTAKINFKKGCGCALAAKTRVKEAHCPLGKW